MHPDLSPHLHTDECNALATQLHRCHTEHPFKKYYGFCNEIDNELAKCLKKEREMRRRLNKRISSQLKN